MNSFIYLDEYKLFSLSAQLFGGLTESVVEYTRAEKAEAEVQKGPIGSGNELSDAIRRAVGTEQRKSFHDYAFTQFEKKLMEDGLVVSVDEGSYQTISAKLSGAKFVAVSGRGLFTDVEMLVNLTKEFNHIGEALTYVGKYKEIAQFQKEAETKLKSIQDRNEKAAIRERLKNIGDVKKLAGEQGLQLDEKYLKDLSFLLTYMIGDDLELTIDLKAGGQGASFSALLNRDFLRERCSNLIRRYSRKTEDPLTIFGIITQGKIPKGKSDAGQVNYAQEGITFRPILKDLAHRMADLEDNFTGRSANEFILDPIAVFKPI
jgi:hypothetical protein